MSFLIDTDICSAHMRGIGPVVNRFVQYGGRLYISSVTAGELYTWALRAHASPKHLKGLRELFRDVPVLDIDLNVAQEFGAIHARLLDQGQTRAGLDLMIAATALVHGLTVVTHNTRDYRDIPGLTIADWLSP